MFKVLKDAKRRAIQNVLTNVGASDNTVDGEFDLYSSKFDALIAKVEDVNAAASLALISQKTMFNDSRNIAAMLSTYYDIDESDRDWPSKMKYGKASSNLKQTWDMLHEGLRNATTAVVEEEALNLLKAEVSRVVPAIDAVRKDRNTVLLDYDSYRRRMKALVQKRDAAEAAGKGGTPAAADIIAELTKMDRKLKNAEDKYNNLNKKAKDDIFDGKKSLSDLSDSLTLTLAVCQYELYRRSAADLEAVLAHFPTDEVQRVHDKVQRMLERGGLRSDAAGPRKAGGALGGLFGGARKAGAQSNASTSPSADISESGVTGSAVPFANATPSSTPAGDSGPFDDDWASPMPSAPIPRDSSSSSRSFLPPQAAPLVSSPNVPHVPVPPQSSFGDLFAPAQAPSGMVKKTALALYDHEPDADDELEFFAGDTIEVLDINDSGWWKGKVRGKTGLFPANYVNLQ